MSSLGDRLKSAREDRGVSQAGLAKAIGARQSSINDIEAGRIKTSTYLLKIANHLNVDPHWLETGVGSIRGVGVEIVNQGATLPLFDWDTVVQCALDNNFDKPVLDMTYRCPVAHSKRAFTTLLEHDRDRFPQGTVLFVDPVGNYKNGDYVVVVFPDSGMMDFCQLVSDGISTYLKSLDPSIDPALRNREVRFDMVEGGEMSLPQTKQKDAPLSLLVGRVIFQGCRFL